MILASKSEQPESLFTTLLERFGAIGGVDLDIPSRSSDPTKPRGPRSGLLAESALAVVTGRLIGWSERRSPTGRDHDEETR